MKLNLLVLKYWEVILFVTVNVVVNQFAKYVPKQNENSPFKMKKLIESAMNVIPKWITTQFNKIMRKSSLLKLKKSLI